MRSRRVWCGLCPVCRRWCDTLPASCGRCAGEPPHGNGGHLRRPDDLEERIARYMERAEKQLPLFVRRRRRVESEQKAG